MVTNEEIEGFLYHLDFPFDSPRAGMWVLHAIDEGVDNIVLFHTAPILTVRLKVMPVPDESKRLALFQRLLELNASTLVHGAYGIEGDSIVLVDTIQSPNLDLNELQGSVEAVLLAVQTQLPELAKLGRET